jgi:predicted permease
MFTSTFWTIFNAIFQLSLISMAAGVLVRKQVVSQEQVQAVSALTVNVFLPCLIVSTTMTRFDPGQFPFWWAWPLSGAGLFAAGTLFTGLLTRMKTAKRHLIPMASIQNGIYFVLPIGQILYPDQFDLFALYCFLLITGMTPLTWSLGKVLLTGKSAVDIQWQDFITPPLVATLVPLLLIFTGLSTMVPAPVISAMDFLGQATVPLAVFILGATIGTISLRRMPPLGDILTVAVVKFMLIPATVLGILYFTGVYGTMPLFSSMMILQSSSPPATNLILMVKHYGGDTQAISSMMLVQYLLALLAMPLWMALWHVLIRQA